MKTQIIYKSNQYHIVKHEGIPDIALEFLESIAWGAEGAVYENKNMRSHIQELYNPSLFAIMEEDEIRGTAAFCNTDVLVLKKSYNCFYVKYFASSPKIRGKGVMKEISNQVMRLISEGENRESIFFACIEKGNRGSYKVVENAGYQNIGTIKTVGFSRFFPKKDNHVRRIKMNEKDGIIKKLSQQYSSHSLVHFNPIFKNDKYYVYENDGEILAACQYHRGHWKVNKMKGLIGKLIIKLTPKIPFLNRIFNPNKFEFLAFEGIYIKDNSVKELKILFESLLKKENLYSSMIWLDKNCPIYKKIIASKDLGILNSFVKDSDVYVLAKFNHIEKSEVNSIINSPLYASAFDYV